MLYALVAPFISRLHGFSRRPFFGRIQKQVYVFPVSRGNAQVFKHACRYGQEVVQVGRLVHLHLSGQHPVKHAAHLVIEFHAQAGGLFVNIQQPTLEALKNTPHAFRRRFALHQIHFKAAREIFPLGPVTHFLQIPGPEFIKILSLVTLVLQPFVILNAQVFVVVQK